MLHMIKGYNICNFIFRYFETTYQQTFEKKFNNCGSNIISSNSNCYANLLAGNSSRFIKNEKMKITTQLIGEKYNSTLYYFN